jgi:hypothetical protein
MARNIELDHNPIYPCKPNQAEIWFNGLAKGMLKSAVWHSKQQLIGQPLGYIEVFNNRKTNPFKWIG